MSTSMAETSESTPAGARFTVGAIDSDVHPNYRNGTSDLAPYVDGEAMRRRMGLTAAPSWGQGLPGLEVKIPIVSYVNPGGSMRVDAVPPTGGPPASDPEFVVKDLLDRYQLAAAVLIGGGVLGLGGLPEPELAAAFASAHNRWIEDVWLRADSRFRAPIFVAPRAPELAVAEIERWANDPRFVSVFIPQMAGAALGKPHYYPIFEAAEHHGLPVTIHPGSESAGINSPMVAVDVPTYYFEFHCRLPQVYQANLISLVIEGVFERFPRLKIGMVEAGFAWLPHVLWRMDKNWKSLRIETPWLKRLPSEYVFDHVRFTTQPMYEPGDTEHLRQILAMIKAERTVMFSTDYPHWDADAPDFAYRPLPADLRRQVTHNTPQDFYRL